MRAPRTAALAEGVSSGDETHGGVSLADPPLVDENVSPQAPNHGYCIRIFEKRPGPLDMKLKSQDLENWVTTAALGHETTVNLIGNGLLAAPSWPA